jgi:hypothetical protein
MTVIRETDDLSFDGRCYGASIKTGGLANIAVGRRTKSYNEKQRMLVIYHEIGHCFFGLQHVSEPRRLMNPNAIQNYTYAELGTESFRLQLVRDMIEN